MFKPFKQGWIIVLALFFMLEMHVVAAKKPIEIPVHPIPLKIQTERGIVSYKVEIAFTQSQAEAGLMYRTDFPHDHAMLFRQQGGKKLQDDQEFFMWMANTPIPLDMIFLNRKGIVVSIVEKTTPFSTDVITSRVPATFALEVNAGEVSKKRIQRGQRIIHPALCEKYEGDIK